MFQGRSMSVLNTINVEKHATTARPKSANTTSASNVSRNQFRERNLSQPQTYMHTIQGNGLFTITRPSEQTITPHQSN